MIKLIKKKIPAVIFNSHLYFAYLFFEDFIKTKIWMINGEPVPPPSCIKRKIIKQYQQKYSYEVFIETGTYLGDTVYSLKDCFKTIYSIELAHDLYLRSKALFSSYSHISILNGSSADILPTIMDGVDEPCIFWLDGHYSGGITALGDEVTPIIKELKCILSHKINNHIILVDDARLFTGEDGYPTLNDIKNVILSYPDYTISDIDRDIIRIINPLHLVRE
ncbi:MAG: hypothetical protein ABSH41_21615 [Syntrophobacteraceae bacterium]